MLQAQYCPYRLSLRFEARTSRAVMHHKDTWLIKIFDDSEPEIYGLGECALFRGLSADDRSDYELALARVCRDIVALTDPEDIGMSSIAFGVETALQDLRHGGRRIIYPGAWSRGESVLTINGLVWMGDAELMMKRISEKLEAGFKCVKLKIGGIDFDRELDLLRYVRSAWGPDKIELRLDANGAFLATDVYRRLESLARFDIHSIEQPVQPGQLNIMRDVCRNSPIPVALDEELIGARRYDAQARLLDAVKPAYIILKPALCGGFQASNRWISLARERGIGWWATSAMESDIGLNAIAQWVSCFSPEMPQGLGTGALYDNNFTSPIELQGDRLSYNPAAEWQIPDTLSWQ